MDNEVMDLIDLKASEVRSRSIVFKEGSNTGEISVWLLHRIIGSAINSPGPLKRPEKRCSFVGVICVGG